MGKGGKEEEKGGWLMEEEEEAKEEALPTPEEEAARKLKGLVGLLLLLLIPPPPWLLARAFSPGSRCRDLAARNSCAAMSCPWSLCLCSWTASTSLLYAKDWRILFLLSLLPMLPAIVLP
jgi:hypothetical protein